MAELEFTGRTALITGAASGIGKAVAQWLDRRGIGEVIAVDLDAGGLDALDLTCQVRRIPGDVSDPELWARIEGECGRLDHAHINAGIAGGGPLVDIEFDSWRHMLSVNLDGAFLGLRTALRVMKKRGTGRSIVLTSSIAGISPKPGSAAYSASKAAVAHLARIAAAEHAVDGIRVNAIAPGRVDTPIWDASVEQLKQELGSREVAIARFAERSTPLGRFATADETAGQIGFLLSDAAANITGTVLVSDGGYSL